MASINWALLCEYAFYVERNKVSLIGVFSAVRSRTLPYDIPQLFVVVSTAVAHEDGELYISATISAPSGTFLRESAVDHVFVESGKWVDAHKSVFGFYGVRFEEPGDYHIEVFINGHSVYPILLPFTLLD